MPLCANDVGSSRFSPRAYGHLQLNIFLRLRPDYAGCPESLVINSSIGHLCMSQLIIQVSAFQICDYSATRARSKGDPPHRRRFGARFHGITI
jgi:hypothetical protein